jgi:hypothetical protein
VLWSGRLWNEWHGRNDDWPPRKLTQGELPAEDDLADTTQAQRHELSGYLRSQFETAWRAYCPSADTPT